MDYFRNFESEFRTGTLPLIINSAIFTTFKISRPHRFWLVHRFVVMHSEILLEMTARQRNSIVSMPGFDYEDTRYGKYHKRYLKLIGITIALTIIGLTCFNHSTENKQFDEPATVFGNFHQRERMDDPLKSASEQTRKFYKQEFQRRQSMTAGYLRKKSKETKKIKRKKSKETEVRKHLKELQKLFYELKYHPL